MDGYSLSRQWFDFAFDSHEATCTHGTLFFYIVDKWNRLGNKKVLGLPTIDTMERLKIKNRNTYFKVFDDLVKWGFIKIVQDSRNQYKSREISLVDIPKKKGFSSLDLSIMRENSQYQIDTTTDTSTDTTIDTTTDTSTDTSTVHIDKQGNNETNKQGNKETNTGDFELFYSSYPKRINRKTANTRYDSYLKKGTTHEEIMEGLKRWKQKWETDKTEKVFIPAPDVWLNRENWNDEIEEQKEISDIDRRFEEGKRRLALYQN